MTRFVKPGAAAGAPAPRAKGRFAGADLSLGLGKPLLPDGDHVIQIGETKRTTIKGDTFMAECTIVESDREDVRPGTVYQWIRSLKDSYGYGVADVCRFVIAVGNMDDDEQAKLLAEVNDGTSVVDAACGVATEYGEQPLSGMKVRVHATREGVKPAQNGVVYPNCTFSPFVEE